MVGQGPRAKNWCFTLINYTPQDLERLASPLEGVEFLIFKRMGPRNLEGVVRFLSRKRKTGVVLGQSYCRVTRCLMRSVEYCKKDGDFTIVGKEPGKEPSSMRNNDIESFKKSVQEGILDKGELMELHSTISAKYPRFVDDYVTKYKSMLMNN